MFFGLKVTPDLERGMNKIAIFADGLTQSHNPAGY